MQEAIDDDLPETMQGAALRQATVPPYDVLDAILFRDIELEQSRAEILAAGFEAATVDKVLRLVRISEWKRQQSAPGSKVSRKAFDLERRYPITSGRAP